MVSVERYDEECRYVFELFNCLASKEEDAEFLWSVYDQTVENYFLGQYATGSVPESGVNPAKGIFYTNPIIDLEYVTSRGCSFKRIFTPVIFCENLSCMLIESTKKIIKLSNLF